MKRIDASFSGRLAAAAQHPLATLRNIWVRSLAVTPVGAMIRIPIHGGYRIYLHPAAISRAYYLNPRERQHDFEVIRAVLRPGDTYVDVGANVGTTVIPAAGCVGAEGEVWAFEPHPSVARYLAENVALNGLKNVHISAVAVDRQPGTVWISDKNSDDQNDISATSSEGLPVPAVRLDDVIPASQVALMKIDVEGAEVRVLLGARRTLERTNAIYFEASERMLARLSSSVRELFVTLEEAGFTVYRFATHNSLAVADPSVVAQTDHVNLIALRDPSAFAALTGMSTRSP